MVQIYGGWKEMWSPLMAGTRLLSVYESCERMPVEECEVNKLPVFEWFWGQGDVLVTVNTRAPEVDVPAFLREKELVDFIMGELPTPRLQADERGILVGMKFSGVPHTCFFPWDSIERMKGPASVIQFQAQPEAPAKKKPEKPEKPEPEKGKHPNLRLIK